MKGDRDHSKGDEEHPKVEAVPRDALDRDVGEIAERAADVGQERLARSNLDIFLTGIIGGVEVSLGALAAMLVVGAALTAFPGMSLYTALALGGLAFPVGFIFVIMGRSELFTENFLIPVVAVLNRERSLRSLVELFAFSWLGNFAGCAVIAALLSVPDAIGAPIRTGYIAYSAYKLSLTLPGLFTSAILAGLVMTALTWVIMALRHTVADILAIFAGGYVLFAANLSHSIIGASILFVGFTGAHKTFLDVIAWLLVATAGNLVGGVGLVTLLRVGQVRTKARDSTKQTQV